ncbi:MAG TPA: 4'-phosphopantetheinyl transferase superfamily protein [Methylobacter sp.]|jgi:4'-phosphopantetheinyl transferase EntD
MVGVDKDVAAIEDILRSWFSEEAFIKASKIQLYPLLDAEKTLVADAVIGRQKEFSTGRWLARQGLQQFGLAIEPIRIGKLRNPLWPDSVLGSISHDAECCAVVLVQKQAHNGAGIGIDLVALSQRAGKLDGLESMVTANMLELDAVNKLNLAVEPALLLFSIKESIIKALSFYLDDFIDMRLIEVSYANKILFKLSGRLITGDVFAAITQNYLLTAVNIYQINA